MDNDTISNNQQAYFKKGEEFKEPQPGDFILTHGSSWTSQLIRFGQALRFRGNDSKFAYWNHCAMVVSEYGGLIEADGIGVKRTALSSYAPKEYVAVRVQTEGQDKDQMVKFAEHALGQKYGFLTVISLGLSLLTGLKFNFGVDDELICSGLVASCLERGWDIFERPCSYMTPADLAKHYQVEIPKDATS